MKKTYEVEIRMPHGDNHDRVETHLIDATSHKAAYYTMLSWFDVPVVVLSTRLVKDSKDDT